jgi:hypothetical protein
MHDTSPLPTLFLFILPCRGTNSVFYHVQPKDSRHSLLHPPILTAHKITIPCSMLYLLTQHPSIQYSFHSLYHSNIPFIYNMFCYFALYTTKRKKNQTTTQGMNSHQLRSILIHTYIIQSLHHIFVSRPINARKKSIQLQQ